MSIKEKFENIDLEKIPENYSFELENIRQETEDFTDEDAVPIFEKEFNYIYNSIIRKKFPTALKDYTPPPPTAEEIAEKLREKERADKEEADRIEAERLKQEKIAKANALLAKAGKKKTSAEPPAVEGETAPVVAETSNQES